MMQGSAYITMGATHYIKGELVQAIEYYKKSLAIVEAMGDERGISATLNNLGAIYYSKGAYDTHLVLLAQKNFFSYCTPNPKFLKK